MCFVFLMEVCACVCSSPESEADLPPPSVQKLSSDLRPLMFWMSNATELLNFFQVKVEAMEKEWEFEGEKKKQQQHATYLSLQMNLHNVHFLQK